MRRIALSAAVLLTLLAGCSRKETSSSSSSSTSASFSVAVVPKGATHEFWKSIHAGALKAAQDLQKDGVRVELIWKGPLREDDREQQVQVVEGFVSQHVSGIVLAPLDSRALVRPVEEARRANIPTVIIDSQLESSEILSFVATDNYHGGELAADEMARRLGNKGRVLMLRYQEGSASTEQREKGFLDRLKSDHPTIELISSNQYAGPTRDTAKRASENLLNRYGDQIQGVFTPNESSTSGMMLALEDAGKAGKLIFVGFDVSAAFLDAIRAGKLHAIVVQNPFAMGELGVKTLVDSLRGKQVPKRVDTGVTLVNRDNLDSPDTHAILHPPLDQYLK